MNPKKRDRFDAILEQVLAELPPAVHRLLDEVPLYVEDYPSRKIAREMGAESPDDLCGLYTGVPLTERRADEPQPVPDVITVYREGILALVEEEHGRISTKALREEIRKTVLHELAHYHGIDEDELWDLGYG